MAAMRDGQVCYYSIRQDEMLPVTVEYVTMLEERCRLYAKLEANLGLAGKMIEQLADLLARNPQGQPASVQGEPAPASGVSQ